MSAGSASARRKVSPAGHWVLFTIIMTAVCAGLLLQGYAHQDVGGSGTALPASGRASAAPAGGSLITRGPKGLTAHRLPDHTVALTFDDGPDPTWTPRILAELRREHVPATFFDVGTRIAAHPDLVRQELAQGDEVGIHTFTHANLSTVPAWRENLELSLSQLALSGASSRSTTLLRLPYSSTPAAVTPRDLATIRQATSDGYLVALADRDSEDWRRPGVPRIVANASPAGGAGAVVMFHDAGGDRSQTVHAVAQLISSLRARGYRFTTVTGGLGLSPQAADQATSEVTHLQGEGLMVALRVSSGLGIFVSWVVIPLAALAVLRTLLMIVVAGRHKRLARRHMGERSFLPAVSIVVPAYNERVGIEAAVRSLAAADYPDFEIIVVDDGSTDGTAELVDSFGIASVRVIRQNNAGKATALNTGIAAARYDILVLVDGDTVFETDTMRNLVQPLHGPQVGAVSGNTKVGNRHGLLGRWQHLEYVVGFNLDRRMYDLFGCITTVPGAIGAFRRDVLTRVGGVSTDTLAEDSDLTMAINRAGFHVVYEERARAWTEAPASLADLWRQRYRWCYGTMQAAWKHRGAVFDTGHGRRLGWIGLPSLLLFQVLMPLLSPLIDLFALFGFLFLDPWRVAAFWVGFMVLQLFTAAYALRLDDEPLSPLWVLPLQQFVYRQLMYLVVIQSVVSALSGIRLRWHKMERSGGAGDALSHETAYPAAVPDRVRSSQPL